MSEIRLISLHQPFATLVAMNLKRYETRSWQTDYRGRIAIHAAKRAVDPDGIAVLRQAGLVDLANESGRSLPKGAIVAIADLTDCLRMSNWELPIPNVILINTVGLKERRVGIWEPDRWAWRLENVRPIANPIFYRGHQGLRPITDADILAAIDRELALTAEIEAQMEVRS